MKKELNKNIDRLDSFSLYCRKHPEQRFWQALRNWSGYEYRKEIAQGVLPIPSFIFMGCDHDEDGIKDTFYLD